MGHQKELLQWVKGDNQGLVEEIAERKEEFIYFRSGRRINSAIINEYMIPINHEEQIIQIPGADAPGMSLGYKFESDYTDNIIRDNEGNEFRPDHRKEHSINKTSRDLHNNQQEVSIDLQPQKNNPITLLIDKSKKDKIKVTYDFEIEIPNTDVYNIINNSFDVDLDQEIIDIVLSTIDNKQLKKSIEESITKTIKSYYKSKNK